MITASDKSETIKQDADISFFKKHANTVIVLGGILGAMLWMNGKFNDIDKKFAILEKEIAIMRTVLITKGIMSSELVVNGEK